MASYYKTIDGKNYDKAILDMAKSSVAGQGDGRISLNDAKKIVRLIQDGGKITDTEKRSLQYVLKKYKFTDTAQEHIKNALGKSAAAREHKTVKAAKPAAAKKSRPVKKTNAPATVKSVTPQKTETAEKETARAAGKKPVLKTLLMLVLLLLLLAGIYYLYSKYKNRGVEQGQGAGIQSDSTINTVEQQKNAEELKSALQQKGPEEVKPSEIADGKNRYVIKEGDTLVKISTERYNDYRKWELIWKHNKGVLKSPIMIFPGQVIILPEDK